MCRQKLAADPKWQAAAEEQRQAVMARVLGTPKPSEVRPQPSLNRTAFLPPLPYLFALWAADPQTRGTFTTSSVTATSVYKVGLQVPGRTWDASALRLVSASSPSGIDNGPFGAALVAGSMSDCPMHPACVPFEKARAPADRAEKSSSGCAAGGGCWHPLPNQRSTSPTLGTSEA